MRFEVLGPLRLLTDDDRQLPVAGRKPTTLVALLVAQRNTVVPADRLVDQLWLGCPPEGARATLQGYVSRLRRLLEPAGSAQSGWDRLSWQGDGYRLRVEEGECDEDLFVSGVERARVSRSADPGAAVFELEAGLGLWRGDDPYGRLLDDILPEVAERLTELRLAAWEDLAHARLAVGRHQDVVPWLQPMVKAHPLRERLWEALMLGLYRCGRQAEALDAATRARRLLADQLGLDPGKALRELETAILRQDPALDLPIRPTHPAALSGGGGPTRESALVGRSDELDHIDRLLAQVRAGQVGGLVVAGEPGIGKTRLMREVADRSGWTTAWGRCHEVEGLPPYLPWRSVLADLGCPTVAPDPTVHDWAHAVEQVLRGIDGPAVVVLDDLQWADDATARVLTVLARELADAPILLAVTLRSGAARQGALATALAAVGRLAATVHLDLPPLTRDEVQGLLERVLGGHLDATTVGAVTARSAGNPLFVTELARLLEAGRGPEDLPAAVADTVDATVAAFPVPARRLLPVLALAGPDMPLDTVASIGGIPLMDAIEALEPVLHAGLLREEGPGRLTFVHDVVRDAVAAQVSRSRRALLHREMAAAVALDPATPPGVVAHHLVQAGDPGAAQACARAAEEALTAGAFESAAAWADRGLRVDDATPQGRTVLTLQVLDGVAHRRLGERELALGALEGVARRALAAGHHDLAARAALELAGGTDAGYWELAAGEPAPGALEWLQRVRGLPGLTDVTLGKLEATLAVQLALAGHDDRATQAASAAREAAEHGGDAALRRAALLARFVVDWQPEHAAARLDMVDELLRGAEGDAAARLGALHLRTLTLLELGRVAEADADAERLATEASELRYDDFRLVAAWWQAMRHLMAGRLDDAERATAAVFEPLTTASPDAARVARTSVGAVTGITAWERGTLPDLVTATMDPPVTDHPGWTVVRALGLAMAGRLDDSYAVLRPRLGPDLDGLGRGMQATATVTLLSEWCWLTRDTQYARALLRRIEPWRERVVVIPPGGVSMGSALLYAGSLEAVLGDQDSAARDLAEAAQRNATLEMPRFVARAQDRLSTLPGPRGR